MRRFALSAVAGLALFAALPAVAGDLDFRIINDTGYTLVELYVSPENVDSWRSDILGKGVLDTGTSAIINFPQQSNNCVYDLKMVFNDGDIVYDTLNLCQTSNYTIN